MFAFRPALKGGQWCVTVRKNKSPRSPVVEVVNCGFSRESAWQEYRRIKTEIQSMPDEKITIDAEILHETENAYLLTTGGLTSTWVPKKVATNNNDGTFTLPETWAYDKGLI